MNPCHARHAGGIAGFIAVAIFVLVGLFGAVAAADCPRLELDNGVISMSLYLPDAERAACPKPFIRI